MEVDLERKVIAGLNRGGEDLVIILKASIPETDGLGSTLANAEASVNDLVNGLTEGVFDTNQLSRYDDKESWGFNTPEEFFNGVETDFVVWGNDVHTRKTSHYEIEWQVPVTEFKNLVTTKLQDRENWDFVRKGTEKVGRYKLCVELYRGGNAD